MKIIVLIENVSYQRSLLSEHGLSIFIRDDDGCTLLFDTGQTDAFLHNAKVLKCDLRKVDHVAISHGHYDHTGGLRSFLRQNMKAKVFIHSAAFRRRYHSIGSVMTDVGMPFVKIPKSRVPMAECVTQLSAHVYLVRRITLRNPWDTHMDGFFTADGRRRADKFTDEQFLLIKKDHHISIISGCSHRGLTNIILRAKRIFDLPVDLVLGGAHLKESAPSTRKRFNSSLQKFMPKRVGFCHCSGVDAYAQAINELRADVFYAHTGRIIEL